MSFGDNIKLAGGHCIAQKERIMKPYAKAFYLSQAWIDARNAYKQSKAGLCERCLANGLYNPCDIVHHEIYITPDNINNADITLNWDNLECLCIDCHNKEHMSKKTERRYVIDENGKASPRS